MCVARIGSMVGPNVFKRDTPMPYASLQDGDPKNIIGHSIVIHGDDGKSKIGCGTIVATTEDPPAEFVPPPPGGAPPPSGGAPQPSGGAPPPPPPPPPPPSSPAPGAPASGTSAPAPGASPSPPAPS